MASCIVPNCKSRTKFKSIDQLNEEAKLGGKSISFFKFPSCPKMQKIWRNNLFENQTTNIKISHQESKICEKHFASTDFIEYNFDKVILKESAVPKLEKKPIDWVKSAKSRLDKITPEIVETVDIDWLLIPDCSINIDSVVKCRFCLKAKKDKISWEEVSTPKFKKLYLQVTGSELHISDKLSQLCCCYCYDRLNDAAETVVYFQECHLKLENFLNEIPKKTIDSKEANEEDLHLSSDNEIEIIEDEFHDNESRDQTYENEVISPESSDNESGDFGKINGVIEEDTPTINKTKRMMSSTVMCHLCLEVFEDRLKFVIHKKEKHTKPIAKTTEIFRCDYCSLKFHTKIKLEDHKEVHHKYQPIDSVKCQRCPGSNFANKRSLGIHIYDKHPTLRCDAISIRRPAISTTCKICNKVSKSSSLLIKHMYLVHRPRTIPCEQCGKMFVNQFKKKEHQLIAHTRERLFICEICGFEFITKDTLMNHQKFVHDNDAERRRRTSSALASLSCSICDNKYVKLKNIKRHMDQVHKEISKREWQLLLNRSCVRCNCIFDNEEYLQDHRQNTCNGTVK